MNVDNLPKGTKLIWEAPEPYEGYSKKLGYKKEGRVYYPCVVTGRKTKNNLLTCHIQTPNSSHWLSGEIEHLRFPTEEELNNLEFPTPKIYK